MYRYELDGLRAFAILVVLINHAHSSWLPGGYLGVDCFFVISGYVVTSSWSKHSSHDARSFYERRLRRLQPALLLMLVISVALSIPAGLISSQHSAAALGSIFGASNLILLSQSLDYFGSSAATNPFTHTWSLGVEEQFYLLFPFLSKKKTWQTGLFLASIVLWLILQINHQEAAFYLMPARIWELSIGILLFTCEDSLPKKSSLSWIGLLAMATAISLPLELQVTGTLLAAGGTSLLLIGLRPMSKIKIFFSSEILVYIGKRSYGLYLWHWPLLVISRTLLPGYSWQNTMIPLSATLLLSWASYKWVEHPIRGKKWGFIIFIPIMAASTALIVFINNRQLKLTTKTNYDNFARQHQVKLELQPCHSSSNSDALNQCLPSAETSSKQRIILIGDSHAAHMRPTFEITQYSFKQLTDRNLPNLWLGGICKEPAYCFTNEKFLHQLKNSLTKNSLVILGISPRRLSGPVRNKEEAKDRASHLYKSISNLALSIQEKDSKLLLLGGLPQINCPKGQSFQSFFNRGGAAAVDQACSPSKAWAQEKNKVQDDVYQSLALKYPKTIKVLNLFELTCKYTQCSLIDEKGDLLFWDELAHLTPSGLKKVYSSVQSEAYRALSYADNWTP